MAVINNDTSYFLKTLKCPTCGYDEGVLPGPYKDTYICPQCHDEGLIWAAWKEPQEPLFDKECPACHKVGKIKMIIGDWDSYKCRHCGYKGSLQEDDDALHWFYNEVEASRGYPYPDEE